MRILVAGDVHGSGYWWRKLCQTAVDNDCPTIFQVGDFGWWTHVEPAYPAAVNKMLGDKGLQGFFIDGNHENFDDLWNWPAGDDGFVPIGDALKYVPRGHVWEWDGVRFLALGGAYSIDRAHRTLGHSWWEQELIRREDVLKCLDAGPADVMLTHDAPMFPVGLPGTYKADALSRANREAVAAVVESARPRLLIHGHYHHRHTAFYQDTRIEGLGCDGDPLCFVVLDTATLQTWDAYDLKKDKEESEVPTS